ncbi:uncharacterized protein SAPINGB_P001078 [Magnusiomyces paraingens]|uniref:Inositol-pentakisphosphate 2-kinase n=1 Tax=Magnusiomyces paraingens TaxID=2606893 RepID=A0A5E8B5Q9_9ASCO|nr:uncharacterized protein SAPINGB_P001078 [Saprochaete ingens]VVT46164.1 unnamed protein product [Saprochaete ingens]
MSEINDINNSVRILSDSSEWTFFAEGAANIIYKYIGSEPCYKGKLLRLRKDIPGNPTTLEVWEFLQKDVLPIIGDYYVGMDLVKINSDFVNGMLNKTATEGQRLDAPVSNKETHAFVMENVLNGDSDGLEYSKGKIKGGIEYFLGYDGNKQLKEVVFEFKPKWLLPSPTTTSEKHKHEFKVTGEVIRCRTCSLSYQRDKPVVLCPLDLVSDDYAVLENAIKSSFGKINKADFGSGKNGTSDIAEFVLAPNELTTVLAKALYKNPLLTQLQKLQSLDTRGILDYGPSSDIGDKNEEEEKEFDMGFLIATAARDCTLFVAISEEDGSNEAKPTETDTFTVTLGNRLYKAKFTVTDVDIKHPSKAKRAYWTNIERTLVDGGWYESEKYPLCNYYKSK